MPPRVANLPHARRETTTTVGLVYRPRDAPALDATAPELEPEEAPTDPVLALEDGATDTEDGAAPCQPELAAE